MGKVNINKTGITTPKLVSDSIQDSSGSAYLTKSVADELYNNGTSVELDPSVVVVSDSSGALTSSTISATELGYLDGVTSNIQTQLNAKQATVTGGATTITGSNLTASRALVSDSSGKVAVSAVTSTELGYLDGVTSNVQTQINARLKITASSSGATWYRKYSDGWIEQGGTVAAAVSTVSFPLAFSNTNYSLVITQLRDCPSSHASTALKTSKTSFTIEYDNQTQHCWYACGK